MIVIQPVVMANIASDYNGKSKHIAFLVDLDARQKIGDCSFQGANTRRNLLVRTFTKVMEPIAMAEIDFKYSGKRKL